MRPLPLFFLLAALLRTIGAAQTPAVSVGTDGASVSTLPGSSIVLFVVARQATGFANHVVVKSEVLTDSDGDGAIAFAYGGPVPVRSIWVAIDTKTGGYGIGLPAAYLPQPVRLVLNWSSFENDGGGQLAVLRERRESLSALVLRPDTGVWTYRGVDGGPADADRNDDHTLRAHLRDFELLWRPTNNGPSRLTRFRSGDVVVAVDPTKMVYLVEVLP